MIVDFAWIPLGQHPQVGRRQEGARSLRQCRDFPRLRGIETLLNALGEQCAQCRAVGSVNEHADSRSRRGRGHQNMQPVPALRPAERPERRCRKDQPGRQQHHPVTDRTSEGTSRIPWRSGGFGHPYPPPEETVARCRHDSGQAESRGRGSRLRGRPGAPAPEQPDHRQADPESEGDHGERGSDGRRLPGRGLESEPEPRSGNAIGRAQLANAECLESGRQGFRGMIPNRPPDVVAPESEGRRKR